MALLHYNEWKEPGFYDNLKRIMFCYTWYVYQTPQTIQKKHPWEYGSGVAQGTRGKEKGFIGTLNDFQKKNSGNI